MGDEQPSPRELHQLIERNHKDLVSDLRDMQTQHSAAIQTLIAQMQQYVLREVYHAEQTAQSERIVRLEKQGETDRERAATEAHSARQTSRMALLTSIGTFLAALAVAAVSAWLRGGH